MRKFVLTVLLMLFCFIYGFFLGLDKGISKIKEQNPQKTEQVYGQESLPFSPNLVPSE